MNRRMSESDAEREDDEREGPSVLSEREAMSLISARGSQAADESETSKERPERVDESDSERSET